MMLGWHHSHKLVENSTKAAHALNLMAMGPAPLGSNRSFLSIIEVLLVAYYTEIFILDKL